MIVHVDRRVELLDASLVHDRDAIGDAHRLVLVVGDEDGGEAELTLQSLDLDLHVQAQSFVQRAERLVEQQHGGLDGERAGHGDALLLASGELARKAITELGEAHDLEELVHRLPDLRALNAARLQAIRDVVGHRHVREERVALEDDPDVAEVGRQVIDGLAVDPNRPRALPHEPGHHAQQRCLAAAGRADNGNDLPLADIEFDAAEDLKRSVALCQSAHPNLGSPARAMRRGLGPDAHHRA